MRVRFVGCIAVLAFTLGLGCQAPLKSSLTTFELGVGALAQQLLSKLRSAGKQLDRQCATAHVLPVPANVDLECVPRPWPA